MFSFISKYYIAILSISLILIAFLVNMPKVDINKQIGPVKINYIGGYTLVLPSGNSRDLTLQKGLDISGGIRVILIPNLSEIEEENISDALNSLKAIIENRINRFGVNEPSVLVTKFNNNYRVIVEIPGIKDVDSALALVGQTAKLSFKIENGEIEIEEGFTIPDFADTNLTSTDIKKADVEFFQGEAGTTNEPSVKLTFTNEGAQKFAQITKDNIGKRLAIYLDDSILIAPVINDQILSGEAFITGQFTLDDAKYLSIQINSGALPVPVEISATETVGPSVGLSSVYKSVLGGLLGLFLVGLFMVLNYRNLGFISIISLLFYGLITLTLYKIIPITLTLPGIAGLILSIGMAVDSNILIFESVKDIRRSGASMSDSVQKGFERAWSSIKDANLVGLIIAFILFNPFDWGFLLTSGPVRGFAATLGLGIFVSLFTGVFITKYLLKFFYRKQN